MPALWGSPGERKPNVTVVQCRFPERLLSRMLYLTGMGKGRAGMRAVAADSSPLHRSPDLEYHLGSPSTGIVQYAQAPSSSLKSSRDRSRIAVSSGPYRAAY